MSTKCELCGKRMKDIERDFYFDKPYSDFTARVVMYQRLYIAGQEDKEPRFKVSSCEIASDVCEECVLKMFKKVLKHKRRIK